MYSSANVCTYPQTYYLNTGSKALPVGDDTTTLVLPQRHGSRHVVDDVSDGVDHALPDAAQITQIEDVVKLGWRRQHFDLRQKTL